jgi:hypothetical protein
MWHWERPGWNAAKVQAKVEAAVDDGLHAYPIWNYPALKTYQGFSSRERVEAWKRIWVARWMGLIPHPTKCSICGSAGHHYHNEDYSRPLDAKPVCRACHLAIHQRFRNPDRWMRLVAKFATVGCWFGRLNMCEEASGNGKIASTARIKPRDVR